MYDWTSKFIVYHKYLQTVDDKNVFIEHIYKEGENEFYFAVTSYANEWHIG